MTDDQVLALIGETGLRPEGLPPAPATPNTIAELLEVIRATRERGYSVAVNTYIDGMGAMAAPVRAGGVADGRVLGCLSIAGPAVRFPVRRMEELAPALFEAAAELGAAAPASHFFAGLLKGPAGQ